MFEEKIEDQFFISNQSSVQTRSRKKLVFSNERASDGSFGISRNGAGTIKIIRLKRII